MPVIMGSFQNHVWRETDPNRRVCIHCGAEVRFDAGAVHISGGCFTGRDLNDVLPTRLNGIIVGSRTGRAE